MPSRVESLLVLAVSLIAACKPAVRVSSPTPDGAASYLVRLGADTVAVEQFRRNGNHIESEIMQRSPLTYVGRSTIEIGANGLATSWTYDPRLVSGPRPTGNASRLLTFGPDSVTIVSDTGTKFSRRVVGGPAVPNVTNSMLTWQLAIDYAHTLGRDSVNVPTVGAGGGRGTVPIVFVTRDSVRSYYGGPDWPVYIKLDPQGRIATFNGTATTIKIVAARVPSLELRSLASRFSVRDQTAGAMGAASTRDTARAQLNGATMWIDYGRPALRGRNPWANGVLGDTLWRTGANAATQIQTPFDIIVAGTTIPAGKYTLWTHVLPGNAAYELVFNKQVGQWGTVYDRKQDLVRVPLKVERTSGSSERFTMMIEPGGDGGLIAMQWATTRLATPFAVKK